MNTNTNTSIKNIGAFLSMNSMTMTSATVQQVALYEKTMKKQEQTPATNVTTTIDEVVNEIMYYLRLIYKSLWKTSSMNMQPVTKTRHHRSSDHDCANVVNASRLYSIVVSIIRRNETN
mmetsp:Transcript_10560/g.11306  ORF Transcript_10560/g.11306 Transcript_10560/m.11306 type:complete len:119 (-) Transcript_10560:1031-1387(-)